MLIRISLIVAIIAGLAVGGLNFIKVKEKIVTLQNERDSERGQKEAAQTELAKTKTDLKNTSDKLKQTETTLATTTDEKDKAVAEATRQTQRGDKLADDLKKTQADKETAQAELQRFVATGWKPEQIINFTKQLKDIEDRLAGTQGENKVLGQKIKVLENRLAVYESPEKPVELPAALKGKILVADPKWNFVVLDIGESQGVLENGELLVNRNGKLVAKVIVKSVQKERCIANVLPGWQLGDVVEGDQVIPAHPAS